MPSTSHTAGGRRGRRRPAHPAVHGQTGNGGANGHGNGVGLLKDRAYNELKQLLLAGQLAGEPFLSERKLARRLGMSNTPVRSGIERLESEGIIAISPQQGIVVRELCDRDIADHYEIREALEPFVVRRLAGRLSPEQIDRLRADTAAYGVAVDAGDIRAAVRIDGEFHLLLCGFLGNADITRCLLSLRDRIYRIIVRAAALMPARLKRSWQEHVRIVEALAAGDGEAAAAAMTEHMRRGRELLLPGDGG
jgi:DNA-binding GntR family transcriptional regulator